MIAGTPVNGGGVATVLNLPVFQPGEIESPVQMFRCAFYRATIAAGVCIARQRHRVSVIGAGHKRELRVPQQYKHCASGDCDQGQIIALRLEGYEPESDEEKKNRRRAEHTRTGLERIAAIEKKLENTEPAPPAEEEKMPVPSKLEKMSDVEIRAAYDVASSQKELIAKLGGVDRILLQQRLTSMGLALKLGRPPTQGGKKIERQTKPAAAVAPAPMVPPDRYGHHDGDLLSMLEARLAHHEGEAARCKKALEALA